MQQDDEPTAAEVDAFREYLETPPGEYAPGELTDAQVREFLVWTSYQFARDAKEQDDARRGPALGSILSSLLGLNATGLERLAWVADELIDRYPVPVVGDCPVAAPPDPASPQS